MVEVPNAASTSSAEALRKLSIRLTDWRACQLCEQIDDADR
jgi:hypothetical protein